MRLTCFMNRPERNSALIGFVFLFLFPLLLFAQTRTISGVVTNESGKPVAGATIGLKNGKGVTTTDDQGRFTMIASAGTVVEITGVNLDPVAFTVDQKSEYTINMKANSSLMNDVVVVGYATQKKATLTGSVATVSGKDLKDRPITNVSTAISGLAPGVLVRQGSGDPRANGATINIRGTGTLSSNAPLVVIDGVIGVLDAVNPQDIESISILKDAASASIYGTLAANGVILVTTKKGSRGRTTVNYMGTTSISAPMNMPEWVTDYATHMRLINEGHINVGQNRIFSDRTIAIWDSTRKIPNELTPQGVPNYIAYPNTNWADAIFNRKVVQNHTVSLNGGSDKVGFLLSLGYLNNPGTVDNTGTRRYQLRANIDAKVNKLLSIGTQTFASIENFDPGNLQQAFEFIRQTTPGVYPVWNGRYGFPSTATGENPSANNVFGFLNNTSGDNQTSRFNTTLYANLNFFKGLSLENRVNYQLRQNETNRYTNAAASERFDFLANEQRNFLPQLANLTTFYQFDKNYQLTIDNVLRYNTTVAKDHSIGALAGYNQVYYNYYFFNATKMGLVDYDLSVLNAALTPTAATGDEQDYGIRSYFGRVNYGFRNKYLLEGVLRYDGVSRFAPDARWGTFPSVSGAWVLSEEGFMKGTANWLNNLKLRGSWGQLGNNASGFYDWQATYVSRQYSFNNVQAPALAIGAYPNPNLQWETTTNTEVGVEATALRNKLNFELMFYRRLTDGILTTTPIPLTAGSISAPVVNAAEVVNQGFDFQLGYHTKIGAVNFSAIGNLSYNINEVSRYRGKLVEGFVKDAAGNNVFQSNLGLVSAGDINRIVEGKMINEYYLFRMHRGSGSNFLSDGTVNINGGPRDGMIRTEEDKAWAEAMLAAGYKLRPANAVRGDAIWYGDLIYADVNGDGDYGNSFDRQFTGTTSLPKFVFGLNMDVSWKQFDLSMIWAGAAGHQLYWQADNYTTSRMQNGFAVPTSIANDRYFYDPANPSDPRTNINGKYTRLRSNDNQNFMPSEYYLYDASWVKLRNLQVGYNLPTRWAGKALLQNARVFFTGENLLMITAYPGLDPEIGANFWYPTMKQYALGVNLTF